MSRFKSIPAQPSPPPAAGGSPVNSSQPSAQQSTKGFFALGVLIAIVVFFTLMIGANSSKPTPASPSSTFGPSENQNSSRTSQTEPTPQPWRGLAVSRDQPPADGNWGPSSKQALREFRKAQRIGHDDTWSLDTQRQLFSPTAAHPVSAAAATYLGGWGVTLEQCRQTPGSPPLAITALRAESYGAICEFAKAQQASPNVWHIRAICMSNGKKWKDNIALTVSEDKLTWVTERRNDQYVRCPSSLAETGSLADYNVSRHGSFVERQR